MGEQNEIACSQACLCLHTILESLGAINTDRLSANSGLSPAAVNTRHQNWQKISGPAITPKLTGLKVGFLNATSLKKPIWEFRQYHAENNSFHHFGIAETRFGPEINDDIISIPGYSVLRQDRNIRGGVFSFTSKRALKPKYSTPQIPNKLASHLGLNIFFVLFGKAIPLQL